MSALEGMTMTAAASLVGQILDDYVIMKELSSGRFARVYMGVNQDGDKCAIKVSRPASEVQTLIPHSTEALMWVTGGIRKVIPDPDALLEMQFKTLDALQSCEQLPRVYHLGTVGDRRYMRMELLEGKTLAEWLADGLATPAQRKKMSACVLQAAAAMMANPNFEFHGDLKPENIILQDDTVRFIDPGYSGALKTEYGVQDCMITTPAYYPTLRDDDLFALGAIVWQIVVGKHPFDRRDDNISGESESFGEDVDQWVKQSALVGLHFPSSIYGVERPSKSDSSITAEQEKLLLKGLRLQMSGDNTLHMDSGFADGEEMSRAWS